MGRKESNPDLLHMRFKFPKQCHDGHGRMLGSIVVRETDAFDSQDAARACEGDKDTNFVRELAKISVVAYRYAGESKDAKVMLPFSEFDDWTNRSAEFALRCFSKLNQVPEAEDELGKGEAVDPETLATR